MIPPRILNAFLAEHEESLEWMKELSDAELDQGLRDQGFQTTGSQIPQWKHQKVATLLCLAYEAFPLFLDMGLGKSRVMLDVFLHRQRAATTRFRGLILVPNITNIEGWREQIALHAPTLDACYLYGSSDERRQEMKESDADLFVVNYEGLCVMSSLLQPAMKRRNRKMTKKKEYVLDQTRLALFTDRIDFVVMDESTKLQHQSSLIFKVCKALCQQVTYKYELTGTPFGRSPEGLWAQYYVLDHGQTFGKTLSFFREAFFTEKANYWGGYVYTFKKKLEPILIQKLAGSSLRYNIGECLDLPPTVLSPLRIRMYEETKAYYRQIHQAAIKKHITKQAIEDHFVRLRMIASGFLQYTTPEGERISIDFPDNPKLDGLEDILVGMPSESKAVVFHFFVRSGELISDRLTKAKIQHVRIHNQTKDVALALREFLTSPTKRVLVVNEQVGSLGLNLQVANYLIFYESPLEAKRRKQAEARCRRPGQEKTVFLYDLLNQGSVEEKIYQYVQEGKNLLKDVLDKGELYCDEILDTQSTGMLHAGNLRTP
jgi:SNF2 family DNA or RNA helicase